MPTVPRSLIDNLTKGVNKISEVNRQALLTSLSRIDYSNMTDAINEIVTVMEHHCGLSAAESARLAQTFYRGMSAYQTGEDFDADTYTGHTSVATEKAVRGIAQLGVDGHFEDMFTQLSDRLDYETKKAAGETIMQNARRDRRNPRFARVPSGFETCDFCLMLASRGAVYWTAETAGAMNHYHANCDCRLVPVWDYSPRLTRRGGLVRRSNVEIEGYDPDEYYREYLDMVADGKRFRSENRWHTLNEHSGSRLNKWQKAELRAMVDRDIKQLESTKSYTDFMQAVAEIEKRWNSLPGNSDISGYFNQVRYAARRIRDEYMNT